ncbi:hypothetical protein HKD37_02G004493 [Glycine soja]
MFSFGFILNNSYSCLRVLTLDLFTSVVPSCVSQRALLRASEGEAHGCAFQRRKDARSRHQRLFVENVRKNRRKPVKMKILSSGVVFTLEEGRQKRGFCSYVPSIEEEIRPT